MSETLYTYKWNDGFTKETYWDSSNPNTFKVPYHSVDFQDDPSHFSRTVIERDDKYKEPVTVALEPTDSQRSRMFICNKRTSFLAGPDNTGKLILKPSKRSLQLLRNGIFWCLDLDKDQMLKFNTATQPIPDDYDNSSKVDVLNPLYNLATASSVKVTGKTDTIDEIIAALPNGILTIPANLVLSDSTGDINVEDKEVPVYSRQIEGNDNLRVEFGEYSFVDYRNPVNSYTSPHYNGAPVGVIAETPSLTYGFWSSIWENSVKTGKYIADLLDTRTNPVGIPRAEDIVTRVNPLRFILSHILATGIIFIVVKSKPSPGETPQEALIVSEEEVNSVPWVHINKLLPTSTNYIILYTQ